MRRLLFLVLGPLAGTLAVIGLAAGPAAADSPHFISEGTATVITSGTSTSTPPLGAYQVANFKEAGLGSTTTTEKITLSIPAATATYACINGGGNHPSAANKETVTEPISQSQNFPVRNGQTTGTIFAGPPGPGSFSCPSGQKRVLAFVSYSGNSTATPPTQIELIGLAGDTSPEPNLSACLFPGVGIC